MLKVSELREAIKGLPDDAICFLPGGSNLRTVDFREDHLFLLGDENAWASPPERDARLAIKESLTSKGISDADADNLAMQFVTMGARIENGAVTTEPVAVPEPKEGDVGLTPETAEAGAEGSVGKVKT